MPRKGALPTPKLKALLVGYKARIITENHEIVTRSDKIWKELSDAVGNVISAVNFYTVVKCNRYQIWDDLSFHPEKGLLTTENESSTFAEDASLDSHQTDSQDSEADSDNVQDCASINFTITLTAQEWKSMSPMLAHYHCKDKSNPNRISRTYQVLKPNMWTDHINAHFWEHTSLPCALTFKRAKVTLEGHNYVNIFARCKECQSKFLGRIKHEPCENSRVHIDCVYIGQYDKEHSGKRKRQLKGSARTTAIQKMNNENVAPSMLHRMYAGELMKFGESEPSHLPSTNVLRAARSKGRRENRLHSDPLASLCIAKYTPPYQNYIKDIGCDKFFLHYYSSSQLLVYKAYCQRTKFPKVSVDATAGLVRRLMRPNGEKSGHIFLYEITMHDRLENVQFSVCDMLSERHDNISIFHWLAVWIRNGAIIPKEAVTDMSLALISAVVRAFTDCSSLFQYLEECAKLVNNPESTNTLKCFVRCDIAHSVKLITSWEPLRGRSRRIQKIREFYVRSMAQIITSSDIDDIKRVVTDIFIVAFSETEGKLPSGELTSCDNSKSNLKDRIATGFSVDTSEDSDFPHGFIYQEKEMLDISQENQECYFEKWVKEIAKFCEQLVAKEVGDRDNFQYLPEIVPIVVKFMKLLPLWSGLMKPIFGYGDIRGSSASSESNFHDLKNRIFSNKTLPLRIDEFLEIHLSSFEGTMKLAHAQMKQTNVERERPSTPDTTAVSIAPTSLPLKKRRCNVENLAEATQKATTLNPTPKCPACSAGNLPTGAHVCQMCNMPVHIFDECSMPVSGTEEGYGQLRICFSCAEKRTLHEDTAVENWRGLALLPKKRKKSKYLDPCPEFRLVDLSSKSNTKGIGLLRNGSVLSGHGSLLNTKVKGETISLTNTCCFDAFVQLFCSAYCDSTNFKHFVDMQDQDLVFQLVRTIATSSVSAKCYRLRAEILMKHFSVQNLSSGVKLVSTESTIANMCKMMLSSYPSFLRVTTCVNSNCTANQSYVTPILCIEFEGLEEIKVLQQKLETSLAEEITTCFKCNEERRSQMSVKQSYLLLETLIVNATMDNTSDIAPEMQITLDDIPKCITVCRKRFNLRGMIGFYGGSKRMTSIGHYVAYCRRPEDMWEVYNDTSLRKQACARSSKQNCQVLFFTE